VARAGSWPVGSGGAQRDDAVETVNVVESPGGADNEAGRGVPAC